MCKSALPFPRASPSASGNRAPSDRTSAVCRTIAQRSRKQATHFFRGYQPGEQDRWLEQLLACHGAGEGAWTVEILSSRSRKQGEDSGVDASVRGTIASMEVRPVYIQPGGAVVPAPRPIKLTGGTGRFILETRLKEPQTFDWDGDQRDEFFFFLDHSQEENNAESATHDRYLAFTFRDGAVRDYAPITERVARIEDVDGDARPDLILKSPWIVESPCGLSTVFRPGPQVLRHALPGGKFVDDDALAQGFIAEQCRLRPLRVLPLPSSGEPDQDAPTPAHQIGCARWWGRSADELLKELHSTYDAAAKDQNTGVSCYPIEELEKIARIDPPQSFRLSCP